MFTIEPLPRQIMRVPTRLHVTGAVQVQVDHGAKPRSVMSTAAPELPPRY
jgi:hypothetical protein